MDRLNQLFTNQMTEVEALLADHIASAIPLIPDMSRYLLQAGGKRIRPLLTLASAALLGYQGQHVLCLAAAVECIHTATLLHDDVVDQAEERRGQASARVVWGNAANVLVGDFLFSCAFQLMVRAENLTVLEILARASSRIAEGEVLQLLSLNNLAITDEHYFNIIERKTAELFAAACEVSGYLAKAPKETCDHLRQLGLHLGIAFQLKDDLLDYTAEAIHLGKTVGKDFFEGKITWPWLAVYGRATVAEQALLQSFVQDEEKRKISLPAITTLMHHYDVFSDMQDRVAYHTQQAKDHLFALSGPEAVRYAFLEIMDDLARRVR